MLLSGFGFGGVNASVVLRKMQECLFLENGVGNACASAVWARSLAPPAAWNVLADRGLSFLNEQGISPSNEG